jgi:hypothetical protein
MDENSIDGLAREYVMRLFKVRKYCAYSLASENEKSERSVPDLSPILTKEVCDKIRPDIREWYPLIHLVSEHDYTHFNALIRTNNI